MPTALVTNVLSGPASLSEIKHLIKLLTPKACLTFHSPSLITVAHCFSDFGPTFLCILFVASKLSSQGACIINLISLLGVLNKVIQIIYFVNNFNFLHFGLGWR